jgi:hypothetical protein
MPEQIPSPASTKPDVRGQYHFTSWMSKGKLYKQAWGWLGMPGEVREFRSSSAQRNLAGGSGDDAGHLIGNRFGAPGGAENLSLQNRKQNQCGTYKDLENRWAQKRLAGVDIFVQVTDVAKPGDVRPFMRNVQWIEHVSGAETRNAIDFVNTHTPGSRLAQGVAPTVLWDDPQIIRVDFRKRERIG